VQAFESFVLRCPKEITPHLDAIVGTSLRFVKHDPNYADEDDDDQMEEDENEDQEDEYSDDGNYSGCVSPEFLGRAVERSNATIEFPNPSLTHNCLLFPEFRS